MLPLLVNLRYLAVIGQLMTIAFVRLKLGLGIPVLPLVSITLALLAFNVATQLWHRQRPVGRRTLGLQLAVDVVALTGLLYFSGGPGNPFVSLYLVPVALSAIALEVVPMVALTVLAAGCYTVLLSHNIPLPHVHGRDFELHMTGMWVNFLLSATIMAAVLSRFIATVKDQRNRLLLSRERAVRDESLLALGSLAAGTAHELNTPLTTLGLLADDWCSSEDPPSREDLALMRAQVAQCRDHVRALADLARRGAVDEPASEPAHAFVQRCVERWRLLRPSVEAVLENAAGDAWLRVTPSLPQALINLMNNAADANAATGSGEPVRIDAAVVGDWLVVGIADRGPGIGKPGPLASESTVGLGMGLLVSQAGIERHGGRVRHLTRDGGGSRVEIDLPLQEAP
ncbi:MAG: hypothetical protein K0M70_05630 [Arenimonas sp.]|uniref:ATP-binding protein n=1 Tax=Arenimonas sp. TaxID=1872635 RepID=UPI0025C10FCF|nr:ATP-binding protein [Arenimonas sp.]MBW8367321.1 hypothetical protein [Arenimonas sp.]